MSRPLRIEFPGALYHVTTRGDRREPIFEDDHDRRAFLEILGAALDRFNACVIAYCLMGNHYHLLVQTHQGNLSRLMRQINGVYSREYNRRHKKVGHLFQGRFKAILVEQDTYLLEVCRYVDLNPVRAHIVDQPEQWKWSSYLSHVRQCNPPSWLDAAALHGFLLGRSADNESDVKRAAQLYRTWVAQGKGVRLWDEALQQQIYLGSEDFINRMQSLIEPAKKNAPDIPITQRTRLTSLTSYFQQYTDREEAISRAYRDGGYTMTAIADELKLSTSWISRLIGKYEGQAKGKT